MVLLDHVTCWGQMLLNHVKRSVPLQLPSNQPVGHAWGCLSSRVSDFLQSGKKSLHFIPNIWWPFKHSHNHLRCPVPLSPVRVIHIHLWHDCRWFLKQVLMWTCLPSHYYRQTRSTKLTGHLALSDIKQSICLDSMCLFAQAARCSSGRWSSKRSTVCHWKETRASCYVQQWDLICRIRQPLSMLTGHLNAGVRVHTEDEGWHAWHQPAGGALVGVPAAHAAFLPSASLHNHRWIHQQRCKSAGAGSQKHMRCKVLKQRTHSGGDKLYQCFPIKDICLIDADELNFPECVC